MKELNMNLEMFEKNRKESEKPVLVEFWAPWCVYCRRIAPAYDKIAEQYEDKLVVGKINVDDVPELAEREVSKPSQHCSFIKTAKWWIPLWPPIPRRE